MIKYAIYQLPEDNAKIRDMFFMSNEEITEISDQYELVGTIEAENLNQVFRIGNFECNADELARVNSFDTMHSISVGDIIHNLESNETWIVGRYGFDRFEMKEVA